MRSTAKSEAEVEAAIRAEIQREEDEIELLRAKAEERRRRKEQNERLEAERLAEMEEERRQREEEQRRRKEEALQRKQKLELAKIEQERKKLEEEMVSNTGGSKLSNILKAKEILLKSPEQLEQEKRDVISSRLVDLRLDGQNKDDLIRQAQEFHEILISLHSQIYDLNEKYDRQKYDMMELAERARQIEKGKSKTRKSNIVHTGLGGSVFNLQETFPHSPGKISLFSRYERVTDRRSFKDRRDLWANPKPSKNSVPEKPKAKINSEPISRNRRQKIEEEEVEEQTHEEEQPQENEEHQEEEHQDEELNEEEERNEEENHEQEHEEEAEDEE
ncbi:troponin T-like isoform X8 [Brachionus plicatilis]|uniref:Troponin T-like isoform X8 n=1 Tax=Brachionus plicatilis TaxID=10195 RepID=A0A3M7SKJ4_BRAPC|nr:troponin T-like isoform X8 [Brachionus plicatilis]